MSSEPNQPGPDDNDRTAENLDKTIAHRTDQTTANGFDDENKEIRASVGDGDESHVTNGSANETTDSLTPQKPSKRSSEPTRLDETFVRTSEQADPTPDVTLIPSQTEHPRKTANLDDATFVSHKRLSDAPSERRSDDNKRTMADNCPATIGRYEILRLLGEGAFGRVYEAHDPQLDRKVAIKVAKQLSRQTQVKRFLREARAAAHLRHPNIIPVYEYGQVDNENIIVYEFVQGQTLKSYMVGRRELSLHESLGIVREIAEGLHYAHEQGIIHRDMKPDNVLIDEHSRPHIADFGCARSIDDQTNLTVDGSILGTPMYMSPEQASGNSNLADGRTDIWSLGVILYEMVSGQRPFEGKLTDLLHRICHEDAWPLRKVAPHAPVDIETICAKCLTRNLDDRFPSAQLLADELERHENGQPILSRRIGPLRRTWMWAKRNQAVATLLITVAVTLLIGTVVSTTFAIQAYREQKSRAMAQLNALTTSEPEKLPEIFQSLAPFRATVLPQLRQQLAEETGDRKKQHRLRMAILELEPDQEVRAQMADEMVEYLLESDAGDFAVCRMCLRFRKHELTERLWATALDVANSNSDRRFRAAAALALYDPESPNWQGVAPDVAGYLTALNQIEMSYWMDSLDSLVLVRRWLEPTLIAEFLDQGDPADTTPIRAAAVLSLMFTDQIELLASLIPKASARQLPLLTDALKINQTDAIAQLTSNMQQFQLDSQSGSDFIGKKSNLITALIQLGEPNQWEHFKNISDRSLSSDLIERLGPASVRPETLLEQIHHWSTNDSDLLADLLLSLGQFRFNQLPGSQRETLLPTLLEVFSKHPSSRVHSSVRWLLGNWGFDKELGNAEKLLRRATPESGKDWHVDLSGNTFALLGPVDQFPMGLDPKAIDQPQFDATDVLDEPLHQKRIPRRFGICIQEVTIQQFEPFEIDSMDRLKSQLDHMDETADARAKKKLALRIKNLERVLNRRRELDKQLPIGDVDYFTALAFCRWLSEKQQLESGFPSVDQLREVYESRTDFRVKPENLAPPGYRIPTASEWEFACRSGSRTLFPFGRSTELAGRYAWYATNSETRLHPVCELKPGNSGLFDALGNASEWCLDWYHEKLPSREGRTEQDVFTDFGTDLKEQSPRREYRGGSFADEVMDLRSTRRFSLAPISGLPRLGFRLARTYPLPAQETATTSADSKNKGEETVTK